MSYTKLKINEIKTEASIGGLWHGQIMTFVRLAGCNLLCEYCNVDHEKGIEIELPTIIDRVLEDTTPYVLITGGEPYSQPEGAVKNFAQLCRMNGKIVHLESNGTMYTDYSIYDWVVISPKEAPDDTPGLNHANEVRVSTQYFRNYIAHNKGDPPWDYTDDQIWYICPWEKEGFVTPMDIADTNIFCRKYPKWRHGRI